MGRISTGSYDFTCRRGVYGIRWRQENGRRKEVSLRTEDIKEAQRLAPQVYADHVSGAPKEGGSLCKSHPATKLDELIAEWIVAIQPELGRNTDETYTTYGKHWLKHMKFLGDVKSSKIGDYQRARLRVVLKATVDLELSALRRFFKWLKEREHIRALPDFPEIGDKVTGVHYAVRRRRRPTEVLSPEQMDAIIAAMPVWSERKVKGDYFPIRPRFVVARETGLRPSTIDGLIARDLIVSGLHIRPENDKNRWERVVPLTAAARAALESVLPKDPDSIIFGRHEWNLVFYRAALKALGPELADKMAPYDLKHGLVTELFDKGAPETGIQFVTGTVSAIRRYAHPTRAAGEEAIRGRAGDKGTGGHRGTQKTSRSAK